MTPRFWNRVVPQKTGATQMPAVELPDGRWLTDTTPMIESLETQRPEPAVIPPDPVQAFASRLVEDYADEWLWRPALHYRWSYRADALLLSRAIVDELAPGVPLPGALKRLAIRLRQQARYVRGDGVTRATRPHVEATYFRALDQLETIFDARPFLLGARPTLADFGFFASMFRHFGLDPTPSAIMRERAPAVWAWLARLWDARGGRLGDGALVPGVPADWAPILGEIGSAYLPYLNANAQAWRTGRRRFDADIQGVRYRLPTSRYRVWCLERLRAHFQTLDEPAAGEARALLEKHGCWEPLWRAEEPRSGHDPDGNAPFGPGLGVFGA
jgi:glutathione S-transferase